MGRAVARKRDYAKEYARRIAAAEAKGKTRQQARGHKEQEHVHRREREREELGGLSAYEISAIRDWAGRYGNKDRDVDEVVEHARENGYDAFKRYRDTWNAARRTYLRESKAGTYSSRGLQYLEMLTGNAGVDEMAWLYYH